MSKKPLDSGCAKATSPRSGDLYDVSEVGTPKAESKGRSHRCSYATSLF